MGRRLSVAVVLAVAVLGQVAASPAWAGVRPGEDVFEFGDAGFHGSTGAIALNAPLVAMAPTSSGGGYWLLARDGGVFSYGDAAFHGSTGGRRLNQPVVNLAPDPQGRGYWFVAADGGVFAFDVPFLGSMGGRPLNQPIVGMAATTTGNGYWLVASDGGIFSFGDARFSGSTGGRRLSRPIVGMAADPDGIGYWLVAADGGVFAFDATFHGSVSSQLRPGDRVVGVAAGTSDGYWLASERGGVFSFGASPFAGAGTDAGRPVIGVAVTPSGAGYWLAAGRTPPPPVRVTAAGRPGDACHPSYDPCVPVAGDVDCLGGTGDGPAYTGRVTVVGPDEYGLDTDRDGVGCE